MTMNNGKVATVYRRYVKEFGADIDIREFARLAERRIRDRNTWPKAMVDAFAQASTLAELEVKALLDQYAAAKATKLQEGLFAQRKRLADAERVLAGPKPTKKAGEEGRAPSDEAGAPGRRDEQASSVRLLHG